ncbi:unnamed protein product [Parnassius apollo]|uniref:(apollo) hypothetical protein n=1 Tax=Parnassius apollo TaxID=110799 RepID=A0A8S3WTB5_PARAO|nr:unnamed protein product [Parnassius apollo]
MTRKLNEDETLKFVQLYREQECLWDKRCDAYKNKLMRASAIEALRDGMNKRLTTYEDNTEDSHSVSSHISTHEQGSSSVNTPRSDNGVENESETPQEAEQDTSQFTPPTKKTKRGKLSQLSDMIKDLTNINNENTNTSICSEETDLDIFGKSVSAQMKKLSEE